MRIGWHPARQCLILALGRSNNVMKPRLSQSGFPRQKLRSFFAILSTLLLAPGHCVGGTGTTNQSQQPAASTPVAASSPAAATAEEAAPLIPADQLDSLVAPIAIYRDSLLSQVLVASTYPLEIVQLQRWLMKFIISRTRRWWMEYQNKPGTPVFRQWRPSRRW